MCPSVEVRHNDIIAKSKFIYIIHYAIFTDPHHIFMLSLLENPNLLEHESFTDLLLAIFHLSEELVARDTLDGLPQSDYEHLAGDIKRAYTLLIREWLAYMMHLKDNYPYLFSLVIRANPLDADASPVVT